jgi:ribosomal protein S12
MIRLEVDGVVDAPQVRFDVISGKFHILGVRQRHEIFDVVRMIVTTPSLHAYTKCKLPATM